MTSQRLLVHVSPDERSPSDRPPPAGDVAKILSAILAPAAAAELADEPRVVSSMVERLDDEDRSRRPAVGPVRAVSGNGLRARLLSGLVAMAITAASSLAIVGYLPEAAREVAGKVLAGVGIPGLEGLRPARVVADAGTVEAADSGVPRDARRRDRDAVQAAAPATGPTAGTADPGGSGGSKDGGGKDGGGKDGGGRGGGGNQTPGPSGPGNSGNAPGQSGGAPGNSGNAPGQSGGAPGNSGNAPGQSGGAPGNSGNAPGLGGSAGGSGSTGGGPGRGPGARSGSSTGTSGNPSGPPGRS